MPLTNLIRDGFVDLGEYCPGEDGDFAAAQLAVDFHIRVWRATESLTANAAHTKPLNTYGGNFGLGRIPLHTDMANWAVPPRFLMLRCTVGASTVTTPLLHHRELMSGISQVAIDRARFRLRRPLSGEMFLVRMLHQGIFRWDELFLVPDNAAAFRVRAEVEASLTKARAKEVVLERPAHTILIDNWAVLHGRSEVPAHALHRKVERAYFTEANDGA